VTSSRASGATQTSIWVSQEATKQTYCGQLKRSHLSHHCETNFGKDYVRELQKSYRDACEEVNVNVPEPLVDKLAITVFVDLDHAHDKITRRSITGMMLFCE
jgi:hypothetical protein